MERREIFRDDEDRAEYLAALRETVRLSRWRLHAYVPTGRYKHQVVETPERTLWGAAPALAVEEAVGDRGPAGRGRRSGVGPGGRRV